MTHDYSLNHSFHENTFPGAEIEESKVFEMLEQNRSMRRAPQFAEDVIEDVAIWLYEETAVAYLVGLWNTPDRRLFRMYINHPEHPKAKVYVELLNDGGLSNGSRDPFPDHGVILDKVQQWLQDNKPEDVSYRQWLAPLPD